MITEQHVLLLAGNMFCMYMGGALIFSGTSKIPPSLFRIGIGILSSLVGALFGVSLLKL